MFVYIGYDQQLDDPIQSVVTSKGCKIQTKDAGITISIPEGALRHEDGIVKLLVQKKTDGEFEFPPGYEAASPAYLVEPNRRVQLQKGVTICIQHYAKLNNARDCENLAFMSAPSTPQYRSSGPVYRFKRIEATAKFQPGSPFGEITLSHCCIINISVTTGAAHTLGVQPKILPSPWTEDAIIHQPITSSSQQRK